MIKINKSRFLKRVVSLGMIAVMSVALVACDKDEDNTISDKSYTYNTYMEKGLSCWNPHIWSADSDNELASYCEMGLIDAIADENGVFQWSFEMAEDIKDITAEFSQKEKYGITEGQTGRVWQIKLNPNACWEDDTPINADTYIESMKLLLDSQMKNSRAYLYYDATQSDTAIYNAQAYYNNDKAGKTKYAPMSVYGYETVEDALEAGVKAEDILIDVTNAFGMTVNTESGYVQYQDMTAITDEEGRIVSAGEIITGKEIYDSFFAPETKYASYASKYIYVPNGVYEEMKFEDVGIIKVDDYTFNYITVNPVTEFIFFEDMTSNWIVKTDIYNEGKTEENGVIGTSYGTSVSTFSSYGPYKLVYFEEDKQFVLEKNDKWYGYTDGKHEGQFQTTKIVVDIIPEHDAQLELFLNGKLDEISLDDNDLELYGLSDRLYFTEQTYTYRWIFATDLDKLIAMEKDLDDGKNKRILSYDDFRKAMSIAMDRERFCQMTTPGYKSTDYLLNNMYYIENNSLLKYRKNDDYNAGTGYDPEGAKALFQSVYEQALADGNYTEGQDIEIRCMVSSADSLTTHDITQQDLLNEMLAEATKGTGFEGKINIKFESGASNRYEDCANGKYEMIRGIWGGATFNPFEAIGCYTNPEYAGGFVHEQCGWNPTLDMLSIAFDFDGDGTEDTVEKTYTQWTKDINDNNIYSTNMPARLAVLSALETGVLSEYQCIPWGTETVSNLLSQKVEYGFQKHNIMYGYGGIRYMTYNYDDEAWDKYVKEQDGTIDYK